MNDTELDEMLNQWKPPVERDSLRQGVLAGFRARQPRQERPAKRRWVWALVGAALSLLVIARAFPQTLRLASPGFRIPYIVEYEYTGYAESGSSGTPITITSFMYGGEEVILVYPNPHKGFVSTLRAIGNSIRLGVLQIAPYLVLPAEPNAQEAARLRAYVSSGCSIGETVIGHEMVLGQRTAVVQGNTRGRITTRWLAPDLGCFALKHTDEVQRPNGTFRLVLRKQALKVTLNP